MPSPIITSIPPYFVREDAKGNEIGTAYLTRCIQSWRDCGFTPVTVNSENEDLHPVIAELGVKVMRVPTDASDLTGRPHVFLSDLLDAAIELGQERAFIVNADIELDLDAEAKTRLHSLGSNQAIGVHRRDHRGDKSASEMPYTGGIDLLGAGHKAFRGLDCGKLVFGMPWWDHYLPLALLWRDAEFVSANGVDVWHLDHGGRWNKGQHIRFGQEFMRLLRATDLSDRRNSEVNQHLEQLERVARGHYGNTAFQSIQARILAALFPRMQTHKRRVLRETSLLNISMLSKITEPRADA